MTGSPARGARRARSAASALTLAAIITAAAAERSLELASAPTVPSAPASTASSPTGTSSRTTARPAPVAERVGVVRVVDGDTLVVSGGGRVRALGIDSCQTDTAGGQRASTRARALLQDQLVTLGPEPGVDTDRYDRALRYVTLPEGSDFGARMAAGDDTAVHGGRNDASPAYLEGLRALELDGRHC